MSLNAIQHKSNLDDAQDVQACPVEAWVEPNENKPKLWLRLKTATSEEVYAGFRSDPTDVADPKAPTGHTRELLDRFGWTGYLDEVGLYPLDASQQLSVQLKDKRVQRIRFVPSCGQTETEEALQRIRENIKAGHETNLRRQLAWLGIGHDEVFALQTLGDSTHCALARGVEEAVRLTSSKGLVAANRWGKLLAIEYQGIYCIPNRMVGRVDELLAPGAWVPMQKGIIRDDTIRSRRVLYLDLDTQRRDESGSALVMPISATKEELHKTIARAVVIQAEIEGAFAAVGVDRAKDVIGFMMSGNGVQLWVGLNDIPEDDGLKKLIRELFALWAAYYDSDVSHVDTTVFDPKRIAPVAGTMKRKGVKRELHRLVTFEGAEQPRRLTLLELQRLVSHYRGRLTPEQRAAVVKLLNPHGPTAARPAASSLTGLDACNAVPIRDVGARLRLDEKHPVCPYCGEGGTKTDVAYIDERNKLNCKHARCAERPNKSPVDIVAKLVFHCDSIKGTKGVVPQVIAWFKSNYNVGGR
ncbi:MAG: hypothetical protein ACHREM_07750 [Polyangiales bacterium]